MGVTMVSALKPATWQVRHIACAIFSLTLIVGTGWYSYKKYELPHASLQRLTHVMEDRRSAITESLAAATRKRHTFCHRADIIALLAQCKSPTSDTRSLGDLLIQKFVKDEPLSHEHHMIVVSPAGQTLYSTIPAYEGTRISLQEQNNPLFSSIARTLMTLTADISEFSYNEELKIPMLWISIPVISNHALQAIIATNVSTQDLYTIIYNRLQLGNQGEVLISKEIPQGTLLLNNTRNNQYKAFKYFFPPEHATAQLHTLPSQRAAIGEEGAGKTHNYMGNDAYAVWQYIPETQWGIIATQPEAEVLLPIKYIKIWLWIVIFFLALTIIAIRVKDGGIIKILLHAVSGRAAAEHRFNIPLGLAIAIGIITMYSAQTGYQFFRISQQKKEFMRIVASRNLQRTSELIHASLKPCERIAHMLAADISNGKLKSSDLILRLQRELTENQLISGLCVAYTPFQFDQQQKLYAPFVFRSAHEDVQRVMMLNDQFDYSTPTGLSDYEQVFYLKPRENPRNPWGTTCIGQFSGQFVTPYSVICYRKKPDGTNSTDPLCVVTVLLDMNVINEFVRNTHVGEMGYSYLLKNTGIFLYHPQYSFKKDHMSISTLAQKKASTQLALLEKLARTNENASLTYFDHEQAMIMETHIVKIHGPDWTLGVMFSQEEWKLDTSTARKFTMRLLTACMLICILLLSLTMRLDIDTNRTYAKLFFAWAIPLFVGQSMLLYIANTSHQASREHYITTHDPVGLERFLKRTQSMHEIVHNPPYMAIPTGIELWSVSPKDVQKIAISGFVWQRYHSQKHKGITRSVLFPQKLDRFSLQQLFELPHKDETIVGWQFYAELDQNFNYTKYPLDAKDIHIELQHPEYYRNILLVPDFSDYASILPKDIPGLHSKQVNVPGFTIAQATFAFDAESDTTSLGIPQDQRTYGKLSLVYELLCKRQLMHAILMFFLPILIILFSIYVVFYLAEEGFMPNSTAATAYTGMLLSIIFLHRSLREQYVTGGILFMEYFFFMAYITILFLVINLIMEEALIDRHKQMYQRVISAYRLLFWQIQLTVSYIITLLIFY